MSETPGTPTTNKKWRIDNDTAYDPETPGSATWVQIRGLKNITPAVNNTVQDATDYDDPIWGSDTVTGRKWQLQGGAFRKEYVGGYDPGQEALRAASDDLSKVHVRWYERGVTGGEAYEGYGIVQWEPQGGDPTALSSASFTVLGQGARTPITNPDSAAAVPTITVLDPDTGVAAGGELVTITGTGFVGTTGVTFDTVAVEDFLVVSNVSLVVVTPAGVAGPADVVVTNATGPSTTGTAAFEYV